MDNEDLFSRARRADPATSKLAGAMARDFITAHQTKIGAALDANGNGTIYEIAKWTGLDHVAVARRMKEMEDGGHAARTGLSRPSPQGRPCTVWAAVRAMVPA